MHDYDLMINVIILLGEGVGRSPALHHQEVLHWRVTPSFFLHGLANCIKHFESA